MTTLDQIKEAHQLLAEFNYELRPVERGYANRTLHINLSDNTITSKSVSQKMKDIFTGGRGFGLWLLWNAVSGKTRWNDPENEIVIAGGPIGGITAYPGSGKSTVVTLSPLTNVPIDSNVGGYFGPYLKFAGWDALEIQGIAERDVIIIIDGDDGRVTIEEAPLEQIDSHLLGRELTEMYSEGEKDRKYVSVVSAGQAAEHVRYSIMNFSFYDLRRKEIRIKQAGRGGCGRVFRQKRIKALVVRYSSMKGDSNNPADMDLIRKAGKRINQEISDLDGKQNNMREVGTAHLPPIMDHFDLLPTHNYRYGSHPEAGKLDTAVWDKLYTHGIPDGCWYGCTLACAHGVDHFHLQTGPYKGEVVLVDGPEYETIAGLGSNIGVFDPLAILEMNFYCDTYGIDTISLGNSIAFVMECYAEGILNQERTDGLELDWGNALAALELLHQMARGEGFGVIVGQGIRYMKQYFAEHFGGDSKFMQDIGMEIKGLEISEYMTKESLAQQGGYGMASKGPQHDEAWLIFMDMVRKQLPTFEAKAEALHYFPLWRTWFSLHGLCKLPWNDIMPANNSQTAEPHKVPEHVENYTWLYEGLSGKPTTPDDLIGQSERVYNFQRLFNLKMGYGTREYDYPPYRAMGPVTEDEYESRVERYDGQLRELVGIDPSGMTTEEKLAKLRAYREAQYETLVDNVYTRRGWSANGIPTLAKVKTLGIDFPEVVDLIQKNA
ncbi:MAG TPA: aldehyde ferredoxin oxidoreductase C-terminal domain-containing protein [Aggregatilineaceae bacterium]|nr:aldehyde ferredoxin oxidoreductase C-terminal domain-containing protein [Aggregatilineaceae bacterium]